MMPQGAGTSIYRRAMERDPKVVFPTRPCVGSGFCCKLAPCPYGKADPETGWCTYLEPWKDDPLGDEAERYRCGRYEFIIQQPGNEWVPAFGAGCGATLFNRDRDRIVSTLLRRKRPPEES